MHIKNFFKDLSNLLSFSLGLIPTILVYIFPSSTKVPFFAFAILLFLFLIAVWLCAKLYMRLSDDETSPVIPIIECSHNVCICKTNDFITHDSIVSFYEKIGTYEKLIGYGYVETVNTKKMAQIKELFCIHDISNLINYINDNKSNIIIRPTVTRATLNDLDNLSDQEVIQ